MKIFTNIDGKGKLQGTLYKTRLWALGSVIIKPSHPDIIEQTSEKSNILELAGDFNSLTAFE